MAIDTPARIAIIGAGPIGLEAALYGRYLGYDVDLYERGEVGQQMADCGQVRMFTPLGKNASPLGLAALVAQYPPWQPPSPDTMLSCQDFVCGYLRPLAQSDLLVDGLHEHSEVLAIGRDELCKEDLGDDESRGDGLFRLLVQARQPGHPPVQRIAKADIVIDASGTFGCPRALGHGAMPAIGEIEYSSRIDYGVPDIMGSQRERFAGQRVLVVGSHWAAALNVVALAELGKASMGTHVTWISGRAATPVSEPIVLGSLAELAECRQMAAAATMLADGASPAVTFWPGTMVESLHSPADGREFTVELSGTHAARIDVERIIGNVGYWADNRLHVQLQVPHCAFTAAPARYAAARAGQGGDGQRTDLHGLINPEPHFYVLGAKSYGLGSDFLIADGLKQIKQIFAIIGDRAGLDLYTSMAKLVPRSG